MGNIYRKKGIDSVTSRKTLKLTFPSKDDLRNAYPLGIQAVPDEDVVRIHSSSGTTQENQLLSLYNSRCG